MFLIIDKEGRRYCQDKKFRDFVSFGTFAECVKVYSKRGWAIRTAWRINCRVVQIPKTITMDSSGILSRNVPCPDKPGYETVEHPNVDEFVVYRPVLRTIFGSVWGRSFVATE